MPGRVRTIRCEDFPPRLDTAALLDVRDAAAFDRGHADGSGHVPAAELKERRAELPPRERPLLVVAGNPEEARAVAETLAELGFDEVSWLDGDPAELRGAPWTTGPPVRLWRPNAFLESVLPAVSADLGGRAAPRAADLAAGSGRDAVFLALHGFLVEAWDSDATALARAAAMAEHHGVEIETRVEDLEASDVALPEGRYDLVVCFRFLHRPLFALIERCLTPGGHLVYETYRRGQEQFGRPRRARFLVEPGELARAFPGLETLRHEEPSPAGGPWTSRIWARKPAGARSSAGGQSTY